MNVTGAWTRRQFSRGLGTIAATAAIAPRLLHATLPHEQAAHRLAFASVTQVDGTGAIHAFHVAESVWTQLSVLPGVVPGQLLMHPSLPVLYVLHDVRVWDYLPRGAVSAFRIYAETGTLRLLNTQPLSLAAVHPRDGVVISKGRSLFVITAAGIYNVLPLATDGSLLPVSAIRKEVGINGEDSATSWAARLHPDGETLLVTRPGQQAIGAFRVVEKDGSWIHRVGMDASLVEEMLCFKQAPEITVCKNKISELIPGVRSVVIGPA